MAGASRRKRPCHCLAQASPSYLILQSLDAANDRMARFRDDLADLLPKAAALKRRLSDRGYMLTGEEPLKVTVCPKSFGYTGTGDRRHAGGKRRVSGVLRSRPCGADAVAMEQ